MRPGRTVAALATLLLASSATALVRVPAVRSGSVRHRYVNGEQTYAHLNDDLHYGYHQYSTYPYWTREWWNAYAVFDITAVPDTVELLAASFAYFQDSASNPNLSVSVAQLPTWDLGPRDMFAILDTARRLAGLHSTVNGPNTVPLDSCGLAAARSALASDTLVLAIVHNNGAYCEASGSNGEYPPELVLELGRVVDLVPSLPRLARPPCAAGGTEPVDLRITNIGDVASQNALAYTIVSGVAVDSQPVPVVGPGDSTDLRVSLPVPGDWRGECAFGFAVRDTLDFNRANDSTRLETWVYPPRTCYVDSFEPPAPFPPEGWLEVSNDTGNYHWYRTNGPRGDERSGIGAARCRWEQAIPNDDWLITPPLAPEEGNPDTVGFFIRRSELADHERVEAWVLADTRPGDTLEMLAEITCMDDYVEHHFGLDDYDGVQVRFALRNRSVGTVNVVVDDFYCSCRNTGGISERPGVTRTPRFSIYPNPCQDRATVSYSLPRPGSARLALFDISGREAWARQLSGGLNGSTRLPALPAGVYLVRLSHSSPFSSHLSLSNKLVVQR